MTCAFQLSKIEPWEFQSATTADFIITAFKYTFQATQAGSPVASITMVANRPDRWAFGAIYAFDVVQMISEGV